MFPLTKRPPFNKGSIQPPPTPRAPLLIPHQRTLLQNKPSFNFNSNRRVYKCKGLVHIASEGPNHRVITLVKYEATQVEDKEHDRDLCFMEGIEEVVEEG